MKLFFKIMFFVSASIGFTGASFAESLPIDPNAPKPETLAVDPNTPAPESPVKLRIPHSVRTKANVLDAVLDFALTQYFKLFKNATVSYDFFEIDANYDLNFTNFVVKLNMPSLTGTVSVPKIKVNFKEFFALIQGKGLTVPKVEITTPTADLTLIEKNGDQEKRRSLKVAAKNVGIKEVYLNVAKGKSHKILELKASEISAVNASVVLSNPLEKYAVAQASIKDVLLPKKIANLTFSSLEADGKTYTDRAEFLRAIKQ